MVSGFILTATTLMLLYPFHPTNKCHLRASKAIQRITSSFPLCNPCRVCPGLFKSQERAKQEAKSLEGLSIKEAHLLGNIGHPQEIEQSQQKTVEHGQDPGSVALAHLTVIFAQRHIASPVEPVFNGPVGPH